MTPPRRAASSAARFLDPITLDVSRSGQFDRISAVNVEDGVNTSKQLRTDLFAGSFEKMERHLAARTVAQDSLSCAYPCYFPCGVETHSIDECEGFFFAFTAGDRSELCHVRCPRLRRI